MSDAAPLRSEAQLNEAQRAELDDAYAELRAAVGAYDEFVGGQLVPGQPVKVVLAADAEAAQRRIDAAEARLWQAREQLLGWSRPSWVPRASLVTDWFSPEDDVYDAVSDPAHP